MKTARLAAVVLCAALTTSALAQATRPASMSQAVQSFAHDLESTMSKGDPSVLLKAFDRMAFANRALEGLPFSDKDKSDAATGLGSAVDGLAKAIQGAMQDDGQYKFLRVHTVNGELRATFRMTGASGLNYHDICLRIDPGQTIRIQDMYVAVSGELLSRTMHRLMLPVAANANRGMVDRMVGNESEYIKHIADIEKMSTAFREKDYPACHADYDSLPPGVKSEQSLMLYDTMSLAHIDDKQYMAAISRYEAAFPDSPSLNLMRLDSTFLASDWDGLIAACDKLDAQVGGDPYLAFYRMVALSKKDKLKDAAAVGEASLQKEPDLTQVYIQLVSVKAAQKDWQGTHDVMERMLDKTGKFLPHMINDEQYADFVKTDEFQKFRKDHPGLKFEAAH